MQKQFKAIFGYRIFASIGILIILVGILMIVFNRRSSYDIGLRYGPPEPSRISGYEMIILGAILLVGIFIFYIAQKRKR